MTKIYNKIDYISYDILSQTDDELRKLIYNGAAAINQRIKEAYKLYNKNDELDNVFLTTDTNEFLKMLDNIKTSNPDLFTKQGNVRKTVKNITTTRQELESVAQDILDLMNETPATKQARQEVETLKQSFPNVYDAIRKGNKTILKGLEETVRKVANGEITDAENPYLEYSVDLAREAGRLYNRNRDSAAKEYLEAVGVKIKEE